MRALKIITSTAVITVAIIYICFKPSAVYSDTIGYTTAKKLIDLGILLVNKDINDTDLCKFLEQDSTKAIAYLSSLRLTGSEIMPDNEFYNDSISVRFFRSDNLEAYRKSINNFQYITSTSLSQADSYRIILDILGYPVDEYGTTDEEVLSYANNVGFGFKQAISNKDSITNGELANIFYEALYICGYNTQIPTVHTLSLIDESFLNKAKELKMIDLFPDNIPLFTYGAFSEGTFKELMGTEIESNIKKYEWSADYLVVTENEYEAYKQKLLGLNWILEVEYLRENNNTNEKCALLYKDFDSTEYYCMLVFNESEKALSLWLAK